MGSSIGAEVESSVQFGGEAEAVRPMAQAPPSISPTYIHTKLSRRTYWSVVDVPGDFGGWEGE